VLSYQERMDRAMALLREYDRLRVPGVVDSNSGPPYVDETTQLRQHGQPDEQETGSERRRAPGAAAQEFAGAEPDEVHQPGGDGPGGLLRVVDGPVGQ
jgi:hypothetical protein